MLKFVVNPASKYAYLRISLRRKFHDLSHVLDRELIDGIKMKKFLDMHLLDC